MVPRRRLSQTLKCVAEEETVWDIQYPTGWKNNSEPKRNSHNTSASMQQLKIKLPKRASMHIQLFLSVLKTLRRKSSLKGFCTCCDYTLHSASPTPHIRWKIPHLFWNRVTFSTLTMNFPTRNKFKCPLTSPNELDVKYLWNSPDYLL